jgi:hypothetical protein
LSVAVQVKASAPSAPRWESRPAHVRKQHRPGLHGRARAHRLAAFLLFYFLPGFIVRPLRTCWLYQAALRGFKYYLAPAISAVGLLYLAVAFGSHYQFNMRDSLGSFCTERTDLNADNDGFKRLAGKDRVELVFDTSPDAANTPNNLCVSTGVFLKTGTRYRVSVKRLPEEDAVAPAGKWTFFGEDSYRGGQPVSHLSPPKSVALALLFPFRRTFDRPWGSIILRSVGKGNEEDFLDRAPPKQTDDLLANDADSAVPEKAESLAEGLTPRRDGELFIYLNKPVQSSISGHRGSQRVCLALPHRRARGARHDAAADRDG